MKNLILFIMLFTCVYGFSIEPDRKYIDHPANSLIQVEQIDLYTSDDVRLRTWICSPSNSGVSSGVLVLAYGFNGNMSYYTREVLAMVNQGFSVIMFDYRGFGESDDFQSDSAMLYNDQYTLDLVTVLDYAKSKFDQPIGVWGLSFGTITATLAYQLSSFDYLIADSYVYSVSKIVDVMQEFLSKTFILPCSAKNYDKALSALTIPILFFNGDRDGLTSANDSYRMKYLNPLSELILYRGVHMQGFQAMSGDFYGQRYIEGIQNFIMKF